MEVNFTIRGEEKFKAFVNENATFDFESAKKDLEKQFLADEKSSKYVLAAEHARDGHAHEKKYMGICMSYDAQGTQLGGGKAYLDKDQEAARKDIIVVFM